MQKSDYSHNHETAWNKPHKPIVVTGNSKSQIYDIWGMYLDGDKR